MSASVLNYETLKNFYSEGEEDLIIEIIAILKEDIKIALVKMTELLATANYPQLKSVAHKLKGGSGAVGAQEISAICRQIELLEIAELANFAELIKSLEQAAKSFEKEATNLDWQQLKS